ncbi:MAG: glycosyltransferase [Pirellulaceae bacterium]|nr:glycosyltransferase [Pirellulaceae bacterium]
MADNDSSSVQAADPIAVTFVVWQGLSAVLPQTSQNVGGLEVFAWRLAKKLAEQPDIQTQFIVRSPGGVHGQRIDGVQLSPHTDRREYIRRNVSSCLDAHSPLRLKRIDPKLLWQIPYLAVTWPWRRRDPLPRTPDPRLIELSPDLWVTLGASRESAGVVATARAQNKPSMLLIQSNADLDPHYLVDPDFRNAYGELASDCCYAIQQATEVVCQTDNQAGLLREHFGREGVIVRNSTDPLPWQQAAEHPGDYVLWIGRYDRVHKRPHLAIEIAQRCPDIPFRMIVNPSADDVRDEIRARCPDNVELIDYVPFDQQPELFGKSRLYLSTGNADYEGFPTVLLQAVAGGKPIVSLKDFDQFIAKSESGTVTGLAIDDAVAAIKKFWDHPDDYDGSAAYRFLNQYHTIESTTQQVSDLVRRLTS